MTLFAAHKLVGATVAGVHSSAGPLEERGRPVVKLKRARRHRSATLRVGSTIATCPNADGGEHGEYPDLATGGIEGRRGQRCPLRVGSDSKCAPPTRPGWTGRTNSTRRSGWRRSQVAEYASQTVSIMQQATRDGARRARADLPPGTT